MLTAFEEWEEPGDKAKGQDASRDDAEADRKLHQIGRIRLTAQMMQCQQADVEAIQHQSADDEFQCKRST
jgi:hypothetical protein